MAGFLIFVLHGCNAPGAEKRAAWLLLAKLVKHVESCSRPSQLQHTPNSIRLYDAAMMLRSYLQRQIPHCGSAIQMRLAIPSAVDIATTVS